MEVSIDRPADSSRSQARRRPRTLVLALLLASTLGATGCVRRSLSIKSEPQGAQVWLNDEEVGRTPVTIDFLWYGDYDVVARMDGYQTLHTHRDIRKPWYQWPFVDFFTETLWPGRIHDERSIALAMTPDAPVDRDELLKNAGDFRERTLFSAD